MPLKTIIISFLIFIHTLFSTPFPLKAAQFNEGFFRLDRIKVLTPTTGLVCATPLTTATETHMTITFPPGSTVSTSLSHWTVATTDIPSDGTPWSGIGTATNVSGRIVTFPSNDLTVGTRYCFRWTNPLAITTGSVATDVFGQVATRDINGDIIDSRTVGLKLQTNDQVTLTASVAAKPSDIEFNFTGSKPDGSILTHNEEITFEVSYRSTLTFTTDFQINTEWTRGLIDGTSDSYVDMFEYVVGSATTSDEGAVPVVDLVNRRITWNITSLSSSPAASAVSFKLRAKGGFNTGFTATSTISATSQVDGTIFHNEELEYSIGGTITPTPTTTSVPSQSITATTIPGPSASPGPGPSATLTPTSRVLIPSPTITTVRPFNFNRIEFTEISTQSFSFITELSERGTLSIEYGTSPENLHQQKSVNIFQNIHTVTLEDLLIDTPYYLQISARNSSGQTITSDIFTAKTSSEEFKFIIDPASLIISADDITLNAPDRNYVIVPANKPVYIQLAFDQSYFIKHLTGSFENGNVLGINNKNNYVPIKETDFIEIGNGQMAGKVLSPLSKGEYEFHFHVQDVYGGFYQARVPVTFYITDPVSVFNNKEKPVENAKITILRYQETNKQFVPYNTKLGLTLYTNEKGILDTIMLPGTYRFIVAAHLHKDIEKQVVINETSFQYPQFILETDSGLSQYVRYIIDTFNDTIVFIGQIIETFFSSFRTLDVATALFQLIMFIIVLSLISHHFHLGFLGLFSLLFHKFYIELFKKKKNYFTLTISESGTFNHPVTGARFYLMNTQNHILYKGSTDLWGEVHIPENVLKKYQHLKVMMYKKGYVSYPVYLDKKSLQETTMLSMKPEEETVIMETIKVWIFDFTITTGIDIIVLLNILFAIFFTFYHGFSATWPLTLTSVMLVLFWLMHVKKLWDVKK